MAKCGDSGAGCVGFDVFIQDQREWSKPYSVFGLPLGEQEASVACTAKEQSPVVGSKGEFLK